MPSDASPGASPAALPLPTESVDTVLLTFAVHEVRGVDDQIALFDEVVRVLRPGGRLVVTEHHRDLRNAAVYGPAAWHFQRRSTWVHRAAAAGLIGPDEVALSPFVHRLVWERAAPAGGGTVAPAGDPPTRRTQRVEG
jgi:ubiquinone/menaquinone biosynthesis C-methylase UbiE